MGIGAGWGPRFRRIPGFIPTPNLVIPTSNNYPIWPFLSRLFRSLFNRYYSSDPNDKLAPAGFGGSAFVQADNSLAYQVLFENKPIATAPAQKILVTDTLDPNLDLATFVLTGITFADQTIAIPAGLDHYETTLPIKANGVDLLADVNASLDRATRTFTLTLQAIDPATGWLPDDPLLGLLYPDDETGRGQGSVSYVVKPLAGLPSGTVITNEAQITFDYNDPMDTPLVHNSLDAGTPTSQVDPLPATTTDSTVTVSWSGQDEAGGSGIAGYDLYVSLDGGAFLPAFTGLTETSATLWVLPGHTYSFYTIAHDNVGHVQATPTAAQATIQIASPLSISSIAAVSPNSRNTAVSTIDVTFNRPINTSSLSPAPGP